jgi:CheY-like chemotaxis protein
LVTVIKKYQQDIAKLKTVQKELIKAKKKAEIASLSKTNFLATVSHELRTPLNAILGMAQILEGQNLTKDQQDCVKVIYSSSQNLLTLINDILDYAKLEAGKVDLKLISFNFVKLIEGCCETVRHMAEKKNIKLETKFLGKIPHKIIGDELKVRQILLNFLSNAVKFTQKGKICVTVDYKPQKKDAPFLITVKDTGIGIPKKALPTLFERFMQVASPHSRQTQGTGLGLAIVKNLVEIMGGDVGVTSQLGKGSRFWFTLNLPIDNNKKTKKNKIKLNFHRSYTPQILVVEDNPIGQKVIQMMLRELSCNVDIAGNGEEAVRLFKKNTYHLIFMDIGLPDKDGMAITRKLRALEKRKKLSTPLIALTAHALEEDHLVYLNAGIDDVLTKPLLREQLISTLNQYC